MTRLHLADPLAMAAIPSEAWNALVDDDYPFLRHEFLSALESTGAVTRETGWVPRHLTLWRDGELVGALPHYLKYHSFGEYVFDWAWADAWERAGGQYYPKSVSAVPFTPVPGPRLLLAEDVDPSEAMHLLSEACCGEDTSGWHLLFAEQREVAAWQQACPDLIARDGVQFQWRDRGVGDFDGFLASLTSKRRKAIRRERRRIAEQGLTLHRLEGADIGEADLAHFYRCYQMTYLERGQRGYLSHDFFAQLLQRLPEALLLIQARLHDRPVAAALCLQGSNSLYGRYWGSEVMADGLHFEACYYQGIEHCLARGLDLFDPGTQGEHKLARGFAPLRLTSLHHIADPRLRSAVARFCREEGAHVSSYHEAATQGLPFKSEER
ncbi:GNAT family N-acetyltransferase [Halomonas sabkhae]|uniref:GNAT family N-acetyltransferase n=1 Tax=Halomonas sabkhae TaxID=626223 RepID=UPI0025B2F22A|nr:GNAT family N-acetyltransferase [Halomonas sabkhae]MDN3524122.1 GNAT family N-acetyltransferase [Halomonas sabkhae]